MARSATRAVVGLAGVLACLGACGRHRSVEVAEDHSVVVAPGDHVTAGGLSLEVRRAGSDLLLDVREGAHGDTRIVSGRRVVKFGAHLVTFEPIGPASAPRVAVEVKAYAPPSPLTARGAMLAADEALSPSSSEEVECRDATLGEDGKTFRVDCREKDKTDSRRTVIVDAATGAVIAVRQNGGA